MILSRPVKKAEKILTAANINENMKKCQYDVRGEIYLAAVKRTSEGKEVIYTNVGNPQALGQVIKLKIFSLRYKLININFII